MKVAAVVVGTDDERFRRVDANRERMQLAERIAGFTKSTADVVLLPAGFLAAKPDREVKRHAESLAEVFGTQVLLAGVDESDGTRSASKARRSRKSKDAAGNGEGRPFWVFASRDGKLIGCGSFMSGLDGSSFDHLTSFSWGRRGGSGFGTAAPASRDWCVRWCSCAR